MYPFRKEIKKFVISQNPSEDIGITTAAGFLFVITSLLFMLAWPVALFALPALVFYVWIVSKGVEK